MCKMSTSALQKKKKKRGGAKCWLGVFPSLSKVHAKGCRRSIPMHEVPSVMFMRLSVSSNAMKVSPPPTGAYRSSFIHFIKGSLDWMQTSDRLQLSPAAELVGPIHRPDPPPYKEFPVCPCLTWMYVLKRCVNSSRRIR